MSKRSNVIQGGLAFALLVPLLIPAAASAHALFADHNPNRPVLEYVWIGFWHMAGGWDHLLFILGVVLIAGSLRPAAKLITLFVAGHSLTLLVATIAGWKLNASVVDVVIALSLVYVGVQGLRGRPEDFRLMGAIVFVFGLVHGLGLSTRLQDLGLPESGVVIRVLLFNIGVELGQLAALGIIVGLGTLIFRRVRVSRENVRFAYTGLIAAGLIAAAVLSFPSDEVEQASEGEQAQSGTTETCSTTVAAPPQVLGGGHPAKAFYGPREQAPAEDLTHVIGDGLVVVRYRPDIAPRHHRALEDFVMTQDPPYAIAAPDPEQAEPIKAVAALRVMSCKKPDMAAVKGFYEAWIAELQARQG
jgi:hydrogenase/urease accessory protein HupE